MVAYYQRSATITPFNAGVGAEKARAATTLADALSDFARRKEGQIKAERMQEGAAAGAAEGIRAAEEGRSPEMQQGGPLSKVFGPSAYDEAFNEVAEKTYITRAEIDLRDQLAKARIDAGGNYAQYEETAGQIRSALIAGADPQYHADLQMRFEHISGANGTRVYEQGRAQIVREGIEAVGIDLSQLKEQVLDAERAGDVGMSEAYQSDFMERVQQAVDIGAISQADGRKAALDFGNDLARATLLRKVEEAHEAGEMEAFLQGLSANSPELSDYFGPPDKVLAEVVTHARRLKSVDDMAKAEAYAKTSADWDVRQARGEVGQADIQAAYDSGELEPNEYSILMRRQIADDDRSMARSNNVTKVSDALRGFGVLDPGNRADREAVNDHFELVLESMGEAPISERIEAGVRQSVRVGMVPDKLKGMIRGNLRSGDADGRLLAAATYGKLLRELPTLQAEFAQKDVDLAVAINENSRLGMAPDEAIALAVESLSVNESVREDRKSEFGRMLKDKEVRPDKLLKDFMDEHFDPGILAAEPDAPPQMQADYEKLLIGAYQRHGEIEPAKQAASATLRSIWGRSRVNGNLEVVKFAPEMWYGQQGLSEKENSEWIRQQALSDAQSAGTEIDTERLRIAPHPVTPIGRDGRPNYMVAWFDERGVWQRINDAQDRPAAWRPDFSQSPTFGRVQKAREKEVERARSDREERSGHLLMPSLEGL